MLFCSILIVCLGIFQHQFFISGELMIAAPPPRHSLNSIENNEDLAAAAAAATATINNLYPITEIIENDENQLPLTEGLIPLDPNDPLSSINIDYKNNAVILQFRRTSRFSNDRNGNGMEPKRRALDNNFMRFGRAGGNGGDLMRFGKRQLEAYSNNAIDSNEMNGGRYDRSNNAGGSTTRDSRGDNFMRFGRSANTDDSSGGSSNGNSNSINMMRFGRPDNLMRFGRSDSNLMRFGRSDSNLMRFGRPDHNNMMRFGRNDKNFMRFGRPENLMRFGRNTPNYMRFGRNDKNFMRFGKLDQNFMRFGKRNNEQNKQKSNDNDDRNLTSSSSSASGVSRSKSNNLDNILFNNKANGNGINNLEFDDETMNSNSE